jgi:DNA-binding transcriptional ArsR family regulator
MSNKVFKALADPTRRRVLELLKEGALTAGELSDRFPVSKPTMSAHFSVLQEAGLIEAEKNGRAIFLSTEDVGLGRRSARIRGCVGHRDDAPRQTEGETQTARASHARGLMATQKIDVVFYHSVACPRCHFTGFMLRNVLRKYPDVAVTKVEFLTNAERARKDGVKAIPTLVARGRSLTGIILTPGKIDAFFESLTGAR